MVLYWRQMSASGLEHSEISAQDVEGDAPIAVLDALESFGKGDVLLSEMPGGASTRRFFRVRRESGRAVAMYIPAPSQAIAQARQSAGGAPFVEVADLLRSRGVSVPDIYERCDERNILLVEDLGHETLANYLEKNEDARLGLYQMAVRNLAQAQLGLSELPPDSVVCTRAFDEALLKWEVDHFRDWALLARGIVLTEAEHDVFERSAQYLAKTIASWQRVFVHRDYQSRNLMVREDGDERTLVWIDFQDAMMGPRVYDLVALLTDSYQVFSRDFVEDRLDDYCAARGIAEERALIGHEFDFLTVQRKLKDAGRFVFIDRNNGNSSFLPFVESTIEIARRALERVQGQGPLAELAELLQRRCLAVA